MNAGNGPHTGQRDDSIGLARATTHAYAGLRLVTNASDASAATAAQRVRLVTEPILNISQLTHLRDGDDARGSSKMSDGSLLSLLVMFDDDEPNLDVHADLGGAVRVGAPGQDLVELLVPVASGATGVQRVPPQWVHVPDSALRTVLEGAVGVAGLARLVIEVAAPATLFALRGRALA